MADGIGRIGSPPQGQGWELMGIHFSHDPPNTFTIRAVFQEVKTFFIELRKRTE